MKYVLTQQAKDFVKSMCADSARAESIIEKAESIFNAEQDSCHFDIGMMKDGCSQNWVTLFLSRLASCKYVKEDWELSADEIAEIGAEEKLAA